jgi:steroid delta-isomerase-like uncharacterized protein
MTDAALEKLSREAMDAYNRADWELMRTLLADDVIYEEIGTGSRFEGVEELLGGMKEWRSFAPDGAGEITCILSDNDHAAMEIIWRGTHTGPLSTPVGALPPTGRSFEMSGALFTRWCNGRVVYERDHVDVLALLSQLGTLPVPA